MKSLAEEINDILRRKFYESSQICGHGRLVRFARPGDWYHNGYKEICNKPPKPPEPIKA